MDTYDACRERGGAAIRRAENLMDQVSSERTARERRVRTRLARLVDDPDALGLVISLTDDVVRTLSPRAAAKSLDDALRRGGRRGFSRGDWWGLQSLRLLSRIAPGLVQRLVVWRLRQLTRDVIGTTESRPLERLVSERRRQNIRINVNVLGEAVLGPREANRRLEKVLEMMTRPYVTYLSVKLSSLVAHLDYYDPEGSRERLASALRTVVHAAAREGVFVNVDMEEYRDLRITMAAVHEVALEEDVLPLALGVVVQAYLPESAGLVDDLAELAAERRRRGGNSLKVRLVKGANLAMEKVEARLIGSHPPTYPTKSDVDASYLDLVIRALSVGDDLRVGVASHNLYHVAFALEVADVLGAHGRLDLEMLEGMAPAEARVLARASATPVISYAPVTDPGDFAAAIAYLVRRLDENTSPDNYLTAAFFIDSGSDRAAATRAAQRARFEMALAEASTVSRHRRRMALESEPGEFTNTPDGDVTDPRFVSALRNALADLKVEEVAAHLLPAGMVEGIDPSRGRVAYTYERPDRATAERVLADLREAQPAWEKRGVDERAAILRSFADLAASERTLTMAVMAHDTGKTPGESNAEVSEAADFAREYATHRDDATALGVVVVTPPWNFPYAIPAGGVLAALSAGNAVVLKPAPEAVLVGAHLADQLWRAGVPRDVLAFVPTGDDDAGRCLVEGADAVVLTGSLQSAVLFTSWRPRLHLLAETSGKNAIVVTARADVDAAARDIAASAFGHAGQKCSAGSLAIVTTEVGRDPAFWRQLRDAVDSYEVGAAYESGSHVGPLIQPPTGDLERALLRLDDGESWFIEPQPLNEVGTLWRPGVKRGTRAGGWSHLTEWFGPVLAVIEVADLDEALEVQNGTRYGLTAGLHSLDATEIAYWLERVRAGNLYVNRTTTGAVVHRQPFGGWRASALGVGPQAGHHGYVAALSRGVPVDNSADLEELRRGVRHWMKEVGQLARDTDSLEFEWNLHRYRPFDRVVVRVEEPSDLLLATLELVREELGIAVELSSGSPVTSRLSHRRESVDELVARLSRDERVRWLSSEEPPTSLLAERGVAVDARFLERDGTREAPRWLRSQSLSITRHRYGNVHAGPRLVRRGQHLLPGSAEA